MPTRDPRPGWVLDRRRQVGHTIATLRAARGLSVDGLAEAAGVDRKAVLRAEHASVSTGLDILVMLAHGLDVSMAALLGPELPQPE